MPDVPLTATEQLVLGGLNRRISGAQEGFAKLNQAAGEERYGPPESWDLRGAFMALAELLVELGLTTDTDLAIRTAKFQAVLLEKTLVQAQQDLRERTGSAPELGWITRPQG